MDPINYSIDMHQPFQNALQGVQAGMGLSSAIDQEAARQQALVQQKAAFQRQQLAQQDIGAFAQKTNKTADDYSSLMLKYPEFKDHLTKSFELLDSAQQKNAIRDATEVHAAVRSGRIDVAKEALQRQLDAATNSGQEDRAHAIETQMKLMDAGPLGARQVADTSGLFLASAMGDKFAAAFPALAKTDSEVALNTAGAVEKKAQAAKLDAEAKATPERLALDQSLGAANMRAIDAKIKNDAGRLGLDENKARSEVELELYKIGQKAGQLDDSGKKLVNDSTVKAVIAKHSAAGMLDLAGRLEKEGGGYGGLSRGVEILKNMTGNQDAISGMRKDYVRLRSTGMIELLPPGPASDKDIQLAMAGFPSETADSATLASFIRGMAKIKLWESANEAAKAEWVNSVGHLGKPKKDIEIDGVQVPAGTTFPEFSAIYMPKKMAAGAVTQAQGALPGRLYITESQVK